MREKFIMIVLLIQQISIVFLGIFISFQLHCIRGKISTMSYEADLGAVIVNNFLLLIPCVLTTVILLVGIILIVNKEVK